MKTVAPSLVLVAGLATSAMAAEPPSPWDVAIGAALMTDVYDRGVTLTAHKPAVQAGFELRYTQSPWRYYAGISGLSLGFTNRAAALIESYGGVQWTFNKLALDLGVWYKYFAGGECFNGDVNTPCSPPG